MFRSVPRPFPGQFHLAYAASGHSLPYAGSQQHGRASQLLLTKGKTFEPYLSGWLSPLTPYIHFSTSIPSSII